jgi:hypothetical protein
MPVDPRLVIPDGAIGKLKTICDRVSPVLAESSVLACYRPVTQDVLPLIGAIPGVRSAYVATHRGLVSQRLKPLSLLQRRQFPNLPSVLSGRNRLRRPYNNVAPC